MSIPDRLPLFRKLYAFTIVISRSVHNMPREYKYTIGAEISKICWNCLDLVVESAYAPKNSKTEKIFELSRQFDKLSLRIRATQELKIISPGQFAHFQENYLLEIGKEIGGWSRWASRQTGQAEMVG